MKNPEGRVVIVNQKSGQEGSLPPPSGLNPQWHWRARHTVVPPLYNPLQSRPRKWLEFRNL